MRLHIRLTRRGEVEVDETIDWSPAPELPRSRHLRRTGLSLGRTDGYHAVARVAGQVVRLKRRNRFEIGDDVLLELDLYPHASAVPSVRGACPACGDAMKTRQSGGAYRSIAREERFCEACQCVVLGVEETTGLVGRFVDSSAEDWVMVTTSLRCPDCLQPMTQGRLSTDEGSAAVERCASCNLLLIEPSDAVALRGEG
ncbi:MAG: hypothetical protein AB8I08_27790 [Sandaracinaceae bacterium]